MCPKDLTAGYVYTENDLPSPSPALYEEASPSVSIFAHHSPVVMYHSHTAPEGNGRGQGVWTLTEIVRCRTDYVRLGLSCLALELTSFHCLQV